MKDGPDLEDGLHADDNNSLSPVPDPRWSPHPVRRQRWLVKPAVVLTSPWPESVYAFAPSWASLSGHAVMRPESTMNWSLPVDFDRPGPAAVAAGSAWYRTTAATAELR